jgi:hypothetical protein
MDAVNETLSDKFGSAGYIRRFVMRSSSRIVLCLLALFVGTGCASTQVTQQTAISDELKIRFQDSGWIQ